MKNCLKFLRRALPALLTLAAVPAFAATSETPEEFHATGDLNGDGRVDVVIVDKVTGVYRIGYGQANGTNTWADGRASGIEYVTGVGVGRLLNTGRDALAFTSPDANRINIFDASVINNAGQPTNVFIPSYGPSRVVALDIGGAGNTLHDDLYIPSIANNATAPYRLTLMRDNATVFSLLLDTNLASEVIVADRIKLKTNAVNSTIGLLFRTAPNLTFAAHYTTNVHPVLATFANNLPDLDAFLFANFNNTAFNQFLLYKAGTPDLLLRPVVEPVVGFPQFGAGATFTFGDRLRQVVAVPGSSDVRLLIIFNEGETAGIYNFDGTNAPVLVESFAADPGETFTGATALGGGNFTLMSGVNGRSTKFQTWNRSGNGYVKGAGGDLPALNPLALSANVFLFANKPFVHPAPLLLRTLNAADWSSGINLTSPVGQVSVQAEKFRNTTQGLGNSTSKNLGGVPAGALFGLPNQIAESFSLLSFSPALGSEVVEVSISPSPGHYPLGISFTLSVPPGTNATIRYRLSDNENWQTFPAGGKIPLFKDTTVSYFAQVGSVKTTIRNATYSFDTPPSDLDTDGDGVPDFVELGLGGGEESLHSKDTDGDGYSDLAEILEGLPKAHPYDDTIVPTNAPRADELSAFDWFVFPRALAGHVPGMPYAQAGTVSSAYDLHGGLLRSTATAPFFGSSSYGWYSNLFADVSQRLYVAGTEPHFDIYTNTLAGWGTNDTRVGREMLRLLPVPAGASGLEVNYTYGGGNLATEAANWVAAAQAAQAAIAPAQIVTDFSYFDTLAALLFERKVGEMLLARGLIEDTNKITLFPFRANDAGRLNPPHAALLSLETNLLVVGTNMPDPNFPGHKLVDIYKSFSLAVTSPPTAQAAKLVDLATEIYRISAVSNNVAPGKFPSPVDTLRNFLETGVLHSNYLAATSLSGSNINDAATGVVQLLAGVAARPTVNLVLKVTSQSFVTDNCVVLETIAGQSRALVLPDGTAFKFPNAFNLAPDSLVEVYAYTDLAASCGAETLEVISLSLFAIPAVSSGDADGDLLADAWECLFLAFDPNGDNDNDGANNLQEFFDGTDPADAGSVGDPNDLTPPQIIISPNLVGGTLNLNWSWPEQYANKVKFDLLTTDALGQPFHIAPDAIQNLGGGNYQATLPNAGPLKFFKLQLSLK